MYRNYLKTTWRTLKRNKGISLINLTGLSIGLAGAILISLLLQHDRVNPVPVHRAILMKQAKINARSTYYKVMRDLQGFGYIRYLPASNFQLGCQVYIKRV